MCVVCRKLASKLNGSFQDLTRKMADLETRINAMELEKQVMQEKVERVESKAEQVKEQVGGIEKEIDAGMQKAKKEVKEEMSAERKEQEQRKKNVVVYGVIESGKTTKEEAMEEDQEKMSDILAEIGAPIKGKVEVRFRAGKKNEDKDKPRPMIVCFEDEESRAGVLENARRLGRKPEWKRIFVSPDLTYRQREEAKKEEEELRRKADKMTEEAGKEGGTGEVYRVIGQRGKRRIVAVNGDARRE